MSPSLQYLIGWTVNGLAGFVAIKWPQYLPEATALVGLIIGKLHLKQPSAVPDTTNSNLVNLASKNRN